MAILVAIFQWDVDHVDLETTEMMPRVFQRPVEATSSLHGLLHSKHLSGFCCFQLGISAPCLSQIHRDSQGDTSDGFQGTHPKPQDIHPDLAAKCHDCNGDVHPGGLWHLGQSL